MPAYPVARALVPLITRGKGDPVAGLYFICFFGMDTFFHHTLPIVDGMGQRTLTATCRYNKVCSERGLSIVMERQKIEWKREWKDEFLKEIASFANTDGGVLKIGIDDDGNSIGVKDPKDVMKKISDTVANKMALYPNIDIDESTGIITVVVERSNIPVDLNGKFYIRSGNAVHEAKGREYDRIVSKRLNISWLDQPVFGMDESVLDPHAIDYFRRKATEVGILGRDSIVVPVPDLLTKLGLMMDGSITRAGALLFHPKPEDLMVGSFTKMGMFVDSEIVVQDIIGGPLVCRFDRLLDTLSAKYLSKLITYDGWTRIENDPFPMASLRECIVNALIHNDYSSFNPVQIRVWPEGMMISDSGGIPEGWTEEDLLSTHRSVPVNPKIAYTFFLMGFIENWGRGMERILKGYENHPGKNVVIRADRSSFQVTMDAVITLNDIRDQIFTQRSNDMPCVEMRIIAYSDVPGGKSTVEIASELGLSSTSYVTRTYLRPMVEAGLLEYTVPGKPTSRNQRYRTTGKGRQSYLFKGDGGSEINSNL